MNMENQAQQLTVRQQTQLDRIQKVGSLSPIGFVKKKREFKKLREMEVQEISQLLTIVFVRAANLAGVIQPISQINKDDIREMMTTKYRDLSIEEIDYAFRHDRYSGDPVGHFQLFNSEYVAKVIKKYLDFVEQVKRENHLKLIEPVPEKEFTAEDKSKIREQYLRLVFDELTESGYCDSAWLLYEEIKDKIALPLEVMKRLYSMQNHKASKVKSKDRFRPPTTGSVANTCRSIVVCNYLKNHVSTLDTFKAVLQRNEG